MLATRNKPTCRRDPRKKLKKKPHDLLYSHHKLKRGDEEPKIEPNSHFCLHSDPLQRLYQEARKGSDDR